jgi:hypothetical protein
MTLDVKLLKHFTLDYRLIGYPLRGSSFLVISGMPTPDFSGVRPAPWKKQLT